MTFEGHSGSAPLGEDLVCCALTTLARTLALAAENEFYNATVKLEEGLADISCQPDKDYTDALDYLFDIIVGGILLIREHYPEYVDFQMIGGKQ